ncbi:hypothetical protein ACO0SA_001391 [Hanseniaspora valbyensis]
MRAEGFSDLGGIYGCSISSYSNKISLSYGIDSGYGDIITQDQVTDFAVLNIISDNVTVYIISFNNADVGESCGVQKHWSEQPNFSKNDDYSLMVSVSNFAFHVPRYMIPEKSDSYTISMAYIGVLCIINIGSGKFLSQNCCINFLGTGNVGGNNTVEFLWSYFGPNGINVILAGLVANVTYPTSIFYANRSSLGAMNLIHTDPSGEIHSDFSADVKVFSYTVYTTAPRIFSKTTQENTGSETSALSTTSGTVYSNRTLESISTLYNVATPPPQGTTTTFTTWSGSFTYTYAIDVITVTDSTGKSTVYTIYYV